MALEQLRSRIARMTSSYRDTGNRYLSRTVHLIVSHSMEQTEEWCAAQAPPVFPDAEALRPWLNMSGGVVAAEAMSPLVTGTMTADLSAAAARSGYQILDHANQVIVIADLRDQDIAVSLDSALKSFDAACAAIGLAVGAFFKVGVFVGGSGSEAMSAATLDSVGQILRSSFDRVFVVEQRNPSNIVIDNRTLLTLIGQLIVHLQERPTSREHIDGTLQYSEWLKGNSASTGRITGFSGATIFLPIENIVETIVRDLTGEELREALLGTTDAAHGARAAEDILNACHMQTLEDLCGHIHAEAEEAMKQAAAPNADSRVIPRRCDSEMFGSLREDIVLLCAQESALNSYISARYAAMQPVLNAMKEELDDALRAGTNSLFSSTQGCVPAAVAAADLVHARLTKDIPANPPEPEPSEFPRALDALVHAWNKGPDGLALSLRAAIAVLALAAAAMGIGGLSVPIRASLLLGAALVGSGAFAYWSSTRSGIKSRIARCRTLLQEQKLAMEGFSARLAIAHKRTDFVGVASECLQRLRDLETRLEHLMMRYGQEARLQSVAASALWHPLEPTTAEMGDFRDGVIYDQATMRVEMISLDQPLDSWNGAFASGEEPINEHEWHVYERAALRLLGHAVDLAATPLGRLLPGASTRLKETIDELSAIYQPFVQLRPGSANGLLRARFALPGPGCREGVTTIPESMRPLFNEIRVDGSGAYTLTMLTFLEDINFGDLRVRPGGAI